MLRVTSSCGIAHGVVGKLSTDTQSCMLNRNCVILLFNSINITTFTIETNREARWPSGRASDSRARGRGFEPHSGRRVKQLSHWA